MRTTPAPETVTGVVGLPLGASVEAAAVVVAGAETGDCAASVVDFAVGVVGTAGVDTEAVSLVEAPAVEVLATTGEMAEPEAAEPPKVKDWLASLVSQAASSRTFALVTVKQVPEAFSGSNARGPAPPVKLNS